MGILIGHHTDEINATGCTVVLIPEGAVAGMDVRGGAPGTRSCDSLIGIRPAGKVHAILFTGGSTFGLGATDGVLQFLRERDWGIKIDHLRIPLVPTAVLFDLFIGSSQTWPGPQEAYMACLSADEENRAVGTLGAGTGAVVGKLFTARFGTKGGLGWARVDGVTGIVVEAMAVVNAFGDVVDPLSKGLLAGSRDPETGRLVNTEEAMRKGIIRKIPDFTTNTTLALVITNARLSRNSCIRVSQMAHSGMARVISPVHTDFDGDLVITLSMEDKEADTNLVGLMAADALEQAILRGIREATSICGIPSAKDLQA